MSALGSWVARLPRRLLDHVRRRRLKGPRIMRAFGRCYPKATFVQIGSNDGHKHDPLRTAILRHSWSGVMVEPVPYVFARLRQNYAGFPNLRLENVAVASAEGTLPFYYLRQTSDAGLPSWYDELGSFRKDVLLSHKYRIPDIESRMVATDIPCVTFASLCDRNGIAAPDLVHIDTEGYDHEIVKTIDFEHRRPALLIYEHKHLDDSQRQECQGLLRAHGYDLFEEKADTWCCDTRPRDRRHQQLMRKWNRISRSWMP